MNPGVIVNAGAGRVKRDPDMVERLTALLPNGRVVLTRGGDEVEPALGQLRDAGVDTLVIVGGDGTVSGTLTPLLRAWPEAELPILVVAAGGTVNTIPKSLGSRGTAEDAVQAILDGEKPREESRRPAVCVTPDRGEPRVGMIFGNGVTTRWLEAYYANHVQGVRGAMEVVGRAVGSAIAGGELARGLFHPFRAKCEIDGAPLDAEEFTIMGASGVQDVGLGFKPFHHAGVDPTRIHFLHTAAGPARLSLDLPGLWFGRKHTVLCHHSAAHLQIRFESPEPWSIDADLYPATHTLEITPTSPLHFQAY